MFVYACSTCFDKRGCFVTFKKNTLSPALLTSSQMAPWKTLNFAHNPVTTHIQVVLGVQLLAQGV